MKKILSGSLVLFIVIACSTPQLTAHEPTRIKALEDKQFKPLVIDIALEKNYHPIVLYEPSSPKPTKAPVKQPRPKKEVQVVMDVPKAIANSNPKKYALERIGQKQFNCLEPLWERESSWNYRAYNKSSGAYGIPQALPGSKMASAGDDWRTNPITQVKWGIRYINSRYGSACGAWNFWKNNHWY